MTAVTYKGRTSGRSYTIGPQIARGGEGVVYELFGQTNKVAKVYLAPVGNLKAEKLSALSNLASPSLSSVSAWPEEVLIDGKNRPVGFVMPAIRGGKPLHLFISPSDRQRHAPNASYATLIAVATNLARAVMTFHKAGVVLADINSSNFLVLPDGTVRVIDCDSVQIGTKAKFGSTVAMVEFVPPELQGKKVADHPRTPDHDNFGLSVLIFLLLMQGRHPFSGSGAMPLGEAIKARRHPFGHGKDRTCPFCVLGFKELDVLSPEIIALFKASFEGGRMMSAFRPTAAQWFAALDALAKSLVTCPANSAHGHTRAAQGCPWCRIEAAGKPPLFVATQRSRLPAPPKKRSLLGALFGN